jgi:hypothetical protein
MTVRDSNGNIIGDDEVDQELTIRNHESVPFNTQILIKE